MRKRSIVLAACALLVLAVPFSSAHGQTETFTDANADYVFEIPSQTWRITERPSADQALASLVYGDRMDGLLQIRREIVDAGVTPKDFAQRESDQKLRFLPGYVEGKDEPFSGRMNGVAFNYEYTFSGKPMTGRIYYLQADNRTIYVLRFTGLRDRLSRIRNQTDSMARSFRLK